MAVSDRHMDTNKVSALGGLLENTAVSDYWHDTSPLVHIAVIAGIALFVHFAVKIVRHISEWFIKKSHAKRNPLGFVTQQPKFITLTRLIVSGVTFIIYFLAVGFILVEGFHFDLTTYLASASIIGLAISFGSQSLVQDLVTGVTLIFSDAMDVGDFVDLSGTMGRVEQIGLRFTKLINFYNQEVFVPNRNIGNVSRFPEGGIFGYADIQLPQQGDHPKIVGEISRIANGTWEQFSGIILAQPQVGNVNTLQSGGWSYVRVQFKIWPGQGALIETTFRQQIAFMMKASDPNYADWMVTITYRSTDIPE